jgi:putative tricarboxylic transport membrane protein
MNVRDQFSGLFWLGISLVVIGGGASLRGNIGSFHYPGPGFFPFWSGLGLGLCSIFLFVKSRFGGQVGKEMGDLIGARWRSVLWVIASLVAYALVVQELGYLLTTFGLMMLLLGLMGKIRIWVRIGGAAVTALLTYVIFNIWLQSQLPEGILGLNF